MAAGSPDLTDPLYVLGLTNNKDWKINTKGTVKLKLYSTVLGTRKSFELWNATFRADLGPDARFLDEELPTLEQWCMGRIPTSPVQIHPMAATT